MSDSTSQSPARRLSSASTDHELWAAVQEDDGQAWEILVRRYEALIYTIATRAGLSMSDAADCFQQTWIQLYRHRTKITAPDRLAAWLATTTKREAIRMRRRDRRHVDFDQAPPIADDHPLPDEEVATLESRARLEAALRQLDDRCAKLLSALFLDPEEKSYEKIAEELGIAKNSMGPVRSRCLDKLARLVEENGWR